MIPSPRQSIEPSSRRPLRDYWLAAGVSLAVSLAIVVPFIWLGYPSGHDIQFHAASWLDAAGQWKQGILFPRWAEWPNYGFGEPRFIFYPPLSWLLGAALSLVLPVSALPGVFIVLCEVLAGLSAYALLKPCFGRPAALFGAASYVANPYALLAIYLRSDYAELLACAFLPLLVLAALRICGLLRDQAGSLGSRLAVFALLFAGVWFSNAPAGLLSSYAIALVIFWAALRSRSVRPVLRGGAGLALGFGLASFYLIPAAYEESWVNISQAIASGLRPVDNFLYTMTSDPDHTAVNWIVSSAAIVLILATAIAALASARRDSEGAGGKQEETRSVWRVMLLLAAVSVFLMTRFSAPVWPLLPKLRFIQFPWRWMAILSVPFAYFLAAVHQRSRRRWLVASAMAVALVGSAVSLGYLTWWDAGDFPAVRQAIDQHQGVEGTDEYDPSGDDRTDLPQNAPRAELAVNSGTSSRPLCGRIEIEAWTAEVRTVRVHSNEDARLLLRLLNYPAWQVRVNGRVVVPEALQQDVGQMAIPVPGGDSRVEVRFTRTMDRVLGGWISVFCAAISALLFWRRGRFP